MQTKEYLEAEGRYELESGNYFRAANTLTAAIDPVKGNRSADFDYDHLFIAVCQLQQGDVSSETAELTEYSKTRRPMSDPANEEWYQALLNYYLNKNSEADLIK